MYVYSPTTRGFHLAGLGQMPADAVPITDAAHAALLAAQAEGQQIVPGPDGAPIAVAPPPPPPAPPIRAIRTYAFRQRLPVATRQTITLAAAAAMRATPPDATLQTWLDDLSSTNTALLDDAELQAGVAALLGAGLITHAERDALLADGTAEEV